MKWNRMAMSLIAISVLTLSACGARAPSAAVPARTTAITVALTAVKAVETAVEAHETVTVGDSKLGKILTDESSHTLYIFENDKKDESTCYDACAQKWPPVITNAEPQAEEGVDGKMLGTLKRKDGKTQVTLNGRPLYYYSGDKAKGDTTGQKIGDVWYVVKPSGEQLE